MSSEHPNDSYQYMSCRWLSEHQTNEYQRRKKECPLPQALLIKMVQNHPSLHWLRSDLLAENVAMAASTRRSLPAAITFVSE
jgi:hypothetical protein